MAGQAIAQIEEQLRDFYAPAFQVLVGGKDLLNDHALEVVSVQVEDALEKADQFTVVINNGFDIESRDFRGLFDLFEFGAPVEVFLGYTDRQRMERLFSGIVTSVTTSFPAQGLPQITVSGYDRSFCLMKRVHSQSWNDKKDSEVVREIARFHKLEARTDDSRVVHAKTEQNQESDYQFIEKLARRDGFEFYVEDKTLHFVEPANDESGIIELEWGMGLVSFSPDLNVAEQVTEVEVRGWDPQQKNEIVGKARVGDEPGRDPNRKSGGELVQQVCKETKLQVRRSVGSQQEADQWARAILKKRAEGFVKGSGESIGIPALRAGRNVRLKGLGKLFSKDYFLEECTHSITTSGYKTTFKVKDTTI